MNNAVNLAAVIFTMLYYTASRSTDYSNEDDVRIYKALTTTEIDKRHRSELVQQVAQL